MTRIFLTLASVSNVCLVIAFLLGLNIGDPQSRDLSVQSTISWHMLIGLIPGLCFAALVHAIVFTYFMGTGRWIEETLRAYQLAPDFHAENQRLKYRLLPCISATILLLILTGALGAAADPASPVGFRGWFGLAPSTVHLTAAIAMLLVNLVTNIREFRALERNGEIINGVLEQVRRIRTERGLPV